MEDWMVENKKVEELEVSTIRIGDSIRMSTSEQTGRLGSWKFLPFHLTDGFRRLQADDSTLPSFHPSILPPFHFFQSSFRPFP